MRSDAIKIVAAIALVLTVLPGGAAGQRSAPPTEYVRLIERPKPIPQIPAELQATVRAASPERLVVRGLGGHDIVVDVEWYEPSEFRLYQDQRFLGMSLRGYEDFGYYLVDRAGIGEAAVLETGRAPSFSPDGRFIAAVELSESGWSNLEGVAVWEVSADGTVRRFFTNAVPHGHDWRVDGWPRPNCVAISAVDHSWQPPEGQDWEQALPNAPRLRYGIEISNEISLRASFDQPACVPPDRP